jgi:perosamine synthetase
VSVNVPLFKIFNDDDDVKAVADVIRSGMQWCIGPQIELFEREICDKVGSRYCVTFNSGGSALHALMLAHGIGPGDEVIVPSFTYIATAFAPMYVGAEPVFSDIESSTFGLDPADIEKRITSKTKAVIPIHYGGMPCQAFQLKEICERHKILLIEDAAEAFGAIKGDKMVGSIGDSAIFSFCHNKIFSTGEGGCAVTDNKSVYDKLRLIQSYGRIVQGDYFKNPSFVDYVSVGYNWRMSSINAALGLSQLAKVDKLIDMRRAVASEYGKRLSKIEGMTIPVTPEDSYHVHQLFTITVDEGKKVRDGLMKYLGSRGISSRVYFDPAHLYSVFNGNHIELPNTRDISSKVLSLPMYPQMTREEIDAVADGVKGFFEEGYHDG